MESYDALYQKAIRVIEADELPESINDLLIKYLNEEPLSEKENTALQNYYCFRSQLLASAKSDTEFSDKIKKLRIIANFTPWKGFLNA